MHMLIPTLIARSSYSLVYSLHSVHTTILRPAAERLSVEVEDDGTQTP